MASSHCEFLFVLLRLDDIAFVGGDSVNMAFYLLFNPLHRVFLDADQREIRGGLDRLNAGSGVDADNQNADDLKGAVAVSRHADVRTSQIRDVDERTGSGIV